MELYDRAQATEVVNVICSRTLIRRTTLAWQEDQIEFEVPDLFDIDMVRKEYTRLYLELLEAKAAQRALEPRQPEKTEDGSAESRVEEDRNVSREAPTENEIRVAVLTAQVEALEKIVKRIRESQLQHRQYEFELGSRQKEIQRLERMVERVSDELVRLRFGAIDLPTDE